MVTAAMKLKDLLLGRKVMTNLDSLFKSRDITSGEAVSADQVEGSFQWGCDRAVDWPAAVLHIHPTETLWCGRGRV